MNRFLSSIVQSAAIVVLGSVIGFALNGISQTPLPMIRPPMPVLEEVWDTLTADEVLQHLNDGTAIIVDARDPNEFEAGHIEGALNLPEKFFIETFQEVGDGLPRDFPIIVYCQGGECEQSHSVLEQLSHFDFQMLYLYKNGWNEWAEKGYPAGP